MKIKKLKINGFGNLINKEIEFKDGINVVVGKNESGKSSTLKFISSILYGVSKNKNGKEISDFDKYYPWNSSEYSGKIEYELDNTAGYEVFRDFRKKNPIIYNDLKEDISKDFVIDKSKGIDFFVQQTGIDEETFLNTAITEQDSVEIERSSQNSVIQKMNNIISSGNHNISYKKSMEKINKRQTEEIGTSRTNNRPINIVEDKIERLLVKKSELQTYKERNSSNFNTIEDSKYEIESEKKKIEFLKELKDRIDNNREINAEIKYSKNLEEDYENKIEKLYDLIEENDDDERKIHIFRYVIPMVLLIIAIICLFVFTEYGLYGLTLLVPIAGIIIKMIYDIVKNKGSNEIDREKIEHEIEILTNTRQIQMAETESKSEKLIEETKKENQYLINKYLDDISISYIEDFISKNYNEIQKEIESVEKNINLLYLKINTLEIEDKEYNKRLEDLSKVEEELESAREEKEDLEKLNGAYVLAKDCLEKAYNQVKQNISPRFTSNLNKIVSKVSEGRYSNVHLNDNDGIEVEIENGSYLPVSRFSIGTIDQMYLSLRLSAIREVSKEKMPIILDETFAYFDNERLSSILKYIKSNYNNQVIIFACSNREVECLESLKIDYNLINLEK